MQSSEKKVITKNFKDIVKDFLKGFFEKGLSALVAINPDLLQPKQYVLFHKIHHIYLLGQLLDLPTLHSVLTYYGIKSNAFQINFNKLKEKLTTKKVIEIYEKIFQQNAREVLENMLCKDSSIFSKKMVTLVLDDSIFKQWLQKLIGHDPHYGCFFSGQFHSTQYGFKVCCLGICIENVFYPLFLDFVPKKVADEQGKNTALTSQEVAIKLVKKWADFYKTLKTKKHQTPILYLSCDSGYSSTKLSDACQENGLNYISVPKKSHLVMINGDKKPLSEFIAVFESKEQEYLENCKKENIAIEPYVWRTEASYCSQKKDVILLFFRLNGSNKASIIYSTNRSVFAKTLRRHWFDRTLIEQFFKLLKHSMKIQNSIVKTKEGFENKLYQFMYLAFYLQKFVHFIRKNIDFDVKQKIGLEGIKRQPLLTECIKELLQQMLMKNSL